MTTALATATSAAISVSARARATFITFVVASVAGTTSATAGMAVEEPVDQAATGAAGDYDCNQQSESCTFHLRILSIRRGIRLSSVVASGYQQAFRTTCPQHLVVSRPPQDGVWMQSPRCWISPGIAPKGRYRPHNRYSPGIRYNWTHRRRGKGTCKQATCQLLAIHAGGIMRCKNRQR